MARDLGLGFAQALAAKDRAALSGILAADVDFKGLTPNRFWDADSAEGVLEVLFGSWFEEQDDIESLVEAATDHPVEDTQYVSYRLAVRTPDGPHVVEQQAYYRTADDRIAYLRVLCSGFRPVTAGRDGP
jgi:hypothetical protein